MELDEVRQADKSKKSEITLKQTKPKKKSPSSMTVEKKQRAKKEKNSDSESVKKKKKKRTPEEKAAYQKRKAAYLEEKKKRRRRRKLFKRIYESTLLTIGLLVLLFILFKIRVHRVEGQSMNPTLKDKEIVLTEKTKNIQRGELVIFQLKNSEPAYVKRVVGMPGDALWLSGNTLFINPYIKASMAIKPSGDKLPSGTISVELKMEDLKGIQGFSSIPANSYFVLGDNYDNSVDSRNFGFVTKEMIDGKVF